jgi:predicted nucleic acid-binding protein
MARYLLDTNIFLRGVDENSQKQAVVRDAVRILIEEGHTCYICSQVLSEAIRRWLDLLITHQVRGKRAHDIKLLGLMQASGISHLVTLNPRDFPAVEGITIVDPALLLE